MVVGHGTHSSFFRSVGAATFETSLLRASHESSRRRHGTCRDWVIVPRPESTNQDIAVCASGTEAEWAEAVARTKRREALTRSKQEQAMADARKQEEVAEAARQRAREEQRLQAEARQRRLEALAAAKEAKRSADADAERRRKEVESASFLRAVEERKEREREIRAMMVEEQATREEHARRDLQAREIQTKRLKELEANAAAQEAEAWERQRMVCEDSSAQQVRMTMWEADERARMAVADLASTAAEKALAAAAWEAKVQQAKVDLHDERERISREHEAMGLEDLAAHQLREADREVARIMEAQAVALATAAAAAAAAEQRARELEALAQEEARRRQFRETECMEREDAYSGMREKIDAQQHEECQWRQAIGARKLTEQRQREAEAHESTRMQYEDRLAGAARCEAQRLEAERLQEQRIHEDRIAAVAAAERAAAEEARQRQAEAMEAERVRAREEALCRAQAERRAMAIAEMNSRMRQDILAAEKRRVEEQKSMGREDALAHKMRRNQRAHERLLSDFEREFQLGKAENLRKAREAARRPAEKKVQQSCHTKEAKQCEEVPKLAGSIAESIQQTNSQLAQKEQLEKQIEQVAEEERQAAAEARRRKQLLAEENQKYEELLRQNRSCLAEFRSREESARAKLQGNASQSCSTQQKGSKAHNASSMEDLDLPPLSLDSGCDAAEIAAFAQKLSVLSPCGQVALELDGTATFFTEG